MSPDVADSVKDLRGSLGGKKKTLVLLDSRDYADVVITVLGRGFEEGGSSTQTVETPYGWSTFDVTDYTKVVRARLRVGDYALKVWRRDEEFWTLAADDLAGHIDKWLKANRTQVIEARREKTRNR